ncbi:hypothetical protein R6Q59_013442, partial [Mikania micrantha]
MAVYTGHRGLIRITVTWCLPLKLAVPFMVRESVEILPHINSIQRFKSKSKLNMWTSFFDPSFLNSRFQIPIIPSP